MATKFKTIMRATGKISKYDQWVGNVTKISFNHDYYTGTHKEGYGTMSGTLCEQFDRKDPRKKIMEIKKPQSRYDIEAIWKDVIIKDLLVISSQTQEEIFIQLEKIKTLVPINLECYIERPDKKVLEYKDVKFKAAISLT